MPGGWYIVRTESRAEYLAAGELARDGIEVFFPCVHAPHPRMGHADAPLFPGYLFLRCDPESQGWPTFRMSHRVLGWVTFGGTVPRVPDEEIAELAWRVDSINGANGLWRRFPVGAQVRVVSRSLESLAEVVEEAKSPEAKAKVLLHFMGRLVQAQVPWKDLQPIDDSGEIGKPPRRTRGRNRWIRGMGTRTAATT